MKTKVLDLHEHASGDNKPLPSILHPLASNNSARWKDSLIEKNGEQEHKEIDHSFQVLTMVESPDSKRYNKTKRLLKLFGLTILDEQQGSYVASIERVLARAIACSPYDVTSRFKGLI